MRNPSQCDHRRTWHRVVLLGSCLVASCGRAPALPTTPLEIGRQLTNWLLAGPADSLPDGAIIDLDGGSDTMLVRWFVDRKIDSLGPEWPAEVSLTLEGRAAAARYRALLEEEFGHEITVIDEGTYPELTNRGAIEYTRVARFSGSDSSTVTIGWLFHGDGSVVGGWVVPSLRAAPSDLEGYQAKTALRLPFIGEWNALDCGRKAHENYHTQHPTLRFACDLAPLQNGAAFRTDGKTNDDFYCFGRPVQAPAPGRIVQVIDSFPENTPGRSPPGYRGPGNVIVIDHRNGEYSVLAHFKRGSTAVRMGQTVATGQRLGECGNNGLSIAPHLHYQLQLDPDPGNRVVPAQFIRYRANGVLVERGEPHRGERLETVRP